MIAGLIWKTIIIVGIALNLIVYMLGGNDNFGE